MSQPMSSPEIETALKELPGWRFDANALEKKFEFADFSAALGFIVRVGIEAERINHHPELSNVWNKVTLRLNTHDAGSKVTAADVKLARAVEKIK
jgi:4a-hydroxytetrahydrobiopterin dehydratase